ncbi:hypothetical protein ACHQM5_018636 [Ranunculus cassubicifolius]
MAEYEDWKSLWDYTDHRRVVNQLMETLKLHPFCSYPEAERRKIAGRLHERCFTCAVSQLDYFRSISMRMRTMRMLHYNNSKMVSLSPLNPPNSDMDDARWKSQFQGDSRLRISSKIMEASLIYLHAMSPEEILEAIEDAIVFEDDIYTSATTKLDYLHKIALKILSIEVNSESLRDIVPEGCMVLRNKKKIRYREN